MQIHLHTAGLIALSAWASPAEEEKEKNAGTWSFLNTCLSSQGESAYIKHIWEKINHAAFLPEANLKEDAAGLCT